MQGARDRRGRHGKDVYLLPDLLEAFFVADSEALLFVYDQQPEVGELHVFREQPMSANQDINFAGFNFLQNFFLLLRAAEAADHLDRDREGSKALFERFEVLEGEHSRGS